MRKEINITSGIKLFCVLAAGSFLLSACGKGEQKNEEISVTLTETDVTKPDLEYPFVTESENGYYVWECISQDWFWDRLIFMDKESGRVVPLCNRPDCGHEGAECNAYFPLMLSGADGIDKHYLQYYEGSLYAVGLSADDYASIFRIKADGSEWEISTKLYRVNYASSGWRTPDLLIDDGYVYFVDSKQSHMKLERIPINGKNAEIVFDVDGDWPVDIRWLKSNDGVIFFQAIEFVDENWENAIDRVYCYDPKVGQCRLVKELTGPYSVQNGVVYYTNEGALCRYSIEKQSTETIADCQMNVLNITLTKNFIILCDQMRDHSLTIFDYEGKKLATVQDTVRLDCYLGGNSDMLFGIWGDERGFGVCFLDLTRPLEELQWEKLAAD